MIGDNNDIACARIAMAAIERGDKNPFAKRTTRYYGDPKDDPTTRHPSKKGGTIHDDQCVNIELRNGKVVAVWFRCQMIPFTADEVDEARAMELEKAQLEYPLPGITGMDLLDPE